MSYDPAAAQLIAWLVIIIAVVVGITLAGVGLFWLLF